MTEPRILKETDEWAAVVKPHGMPSAPLPGREEGTLLAWFLSRRPEAASVVGRKPIERGLVHRLDTATWGIVLFAKTQAAYDFLRDFQERDLVTKRYVALCRESVSLNDRAFDALVGTSAFPVSITSGFRSWGPKGREVRPLFPGDKGAAEATRAYTTIVESVEPYALDGGNRRVYRASCALTRGYRHQIRAHLAFSGMPILCDAVYGAFREEGDLGLYAVEISFPSFERDRRESVSLPPPDRTIP